MTQLLVHRSLEIFHDSIVYELQFKRYVPKINYGPKTNDFWLSTYIVGFFIYVWLEDNIFEFLTL
jgi:hypothetical protein